MARPITRNGEEGGKRYQFYFWRFEKGKLQMGDACLVALPKKKKNKVTIRKTVRDWKRGENGTLGSERRFVNRGGGPAISLEKEKERDFYKMEGRRKRSSWGGCCKRAQNFRLPLCEEKRIYKTGLWAK